METTMNNDMCRCCATVGTFKDIKTKYHWMGEEEIYADMLKDYLDITLAAVDGESNGICEVCITQLRNAANFKKQVQHTEQRFQRHLQDKIFAQNIVKEEASGDEDVDSDNMGDDFVPDYDVSIKSETEDKPKKRTTRASTSKNKIITLDGGESSKKRIRRIGNDRSVKRVKRVRLRGIKRRSSDLAKHHHNVREILRSSNATALGSHSDTGYSCFYCKDSYKNPAELKHHTISSHTDNTSNLSNPDGLLGFMVKVDITGLLCKICEKDIDSLEELMDHLITYHEKVVHKDIKCQIIPFKFDVDYQDDALKCCVCLEEYTNFRKLVEHMREHYRNYVCQYCDAGFVSERQLFTHKSVHRIGNYLCMYCSKVFDSLLKKKTHEMKVHIRLKGMHKCGYCSLHFPEFTLKNKHMSEVHNMGRQPSVSCPACNKVFTNIKKKNIHIRRYHLLEKKHVCQYCSIRYFSKNDLMKHLTLHKAKVYQCDICFKTYSRKSLLVQHKPVHDGFRFKCINCGKGFSQKVSLMRHLRSTKNPCFTENLTDEWIESDISD